MVKHGNALATDHVFGSRVVINHRMDVGVGVVVFAVEVAVLVADCAVIDDADISDDVAAAIADCCCCWCDSGRYCGCGLQLKPILFLLRLTCRSRMLCF